MSTPVINDAAKAAIQSDYFGYQPLKNEKGELVVNAETGKAQFDLGFCYTQTTLAPAQESLDLDFVAVTAANVAADKAQVADKAEAAAKTAHETAGKAKAAIPSLKSEYGGFEVKDGALTHGKWSDKGRPDAVMLFDADVKAIAAAQKVYTDATEAAKTADGVAKTARADANVAAEAAKKALDAAQTKPELPSIFLRPFYAVKDAVMWVVNSILGLFGKVAAIFKGIFSYEDKAEETTAAAPEAKKADAPVVAK